MNMRQKTKRRLVILVLVCLAIGGIGAIAYTYSQHQIARRTADRRAEGLRLFEAGEYEACLKPLSESISRNPDDPEARLAFAKARVRVKDPEVPYIQEGIFHLLYCLSVNPDNIEVRHLLLDLYLGSGRLAEAIAQADELLARNPQDTKALKLKAIALGHLDRHAEAIATSVRYNELLPDDLAGQGLTLKLMWKARTPAADVRKHIAQAREHYRKNTQQQEIPADREAVFKLLDTSGPDYERVFANSIDESVRLYREFLRCTDAARASLDNEAAAKILRNDPVFIDSLVGLYETLNVPVITLDDSGEVAEKIAPGRKLNEEAEALLSRVVSQTENPAVALVLVRRLFHDHRYTEILKLLENENVSFPREDTALLQYYALSLLASEKSEEATSKAMDILQTLESRRNDYPARASAIAIKARFLSENLNAAQRLAEFRKALSLDDRNALIHYYCGEAHAELRDVVAAGDRLRTASGLDPNWPQPRIYLIQLLARERRVEEALAELNKIPEWERKTHLRWIRLSAITYYACAQALNRPDDWKEAAKFAATVQNHEALRGDPETLVIKIATLMHKFTTLMHEFTTLMRKGSDANRQMAEAAREEAEAAREQAKAAIDKAISDRSRPPSPGLRIKLFELSRMYDLGMESKILSENQPPANDPGLDLAWALHKADNSNLSSEEAIKAGEDYLQLRIAANQNNPKPWQWVLAKYLEFMLPSTVDENSAEAANNPFWVKARSAWKQLAETYPSDRDIQRAVLSARSPWNDLDFIAKTIDRYVTIMGDDTYVTSLARAKWLISISDKDPATKDKNLADAISVLSRLIGNGGDYEPYLLRARAMLLRNNIGSAIDDLRAAAKLVPTKTEVVFELVRRLEQSGRRDEARQYLQGLSRSHQLDNRDRRYLAERFASNGNISDAIEVLQAGGKDDLTRVQLAELYRRANKPEVAQTIYDELLRKPEPSLLAIASAADFFATHNDRKRAEEILARLASVENAPPGARELILGQFHEKHTGLAEAETHYLAAVQANPRNATAHRLLIMVYLRTDLNKARDAASKAVAALPDDEQLRLLQARVNAAKPTSDPGGGTDLAVVLGNDPAAEKAMVIQNRLRKGEISIQQALNEIRTLADNNLTSFPAQRIAIELYMEAGEFQRAIVIAQRTMENLPNSDKAAELATRVYMLSGRASRDDALRAAEEWRRRTPEAPMAADIAIAECNVLLGKPDLAVSQLKSYVETARKSPDDSRHSALLAVYMRALCMTPSGTDEAIQIITPLMKESSFWRTTWLFNSRQILKDPVADGNRIRVVEKEILAGGSADEKYTLARTWFELGQNYNGYRPALIEARDLLRQIAAEPNPQARVLVLLGMTCEGLAFLSPPDDRQPHIDAAIEAYANALKIDSTHPIASNNLAYLLSEQNRELDRALALAQTAVNATDDQIRKARDDEGTPTTTSPGDIKVSRSSFYDTLGSIHLRAGRFDDAASAYDNAVTLASNNTQALFGLVRAYQKAGKLDKAREALTKLKHLIPDNAEVLELEKALNDQV